jgi:DNA-binding MarR family transcriptional regulator
MADADAQRALDIIARFSDDGDTIIQRICGPGWSANRHAVVLALIFRDEGLTTREISRRSGMGRRQLARLITSLRSDGLIHVERSDEDGRSVVVELTPAGAARQRALTDALDAWLTQYADEAEAVVVELGGHLDLDAPAETDPLLIVQRIGSAGVAFADELTSTEIGAEIYGRQRSAVMQIAGRGPVQPSELAWMLGASRSGTSYVIDQLCNRGLMQRSHPTDLSDGRIVLVSLTPSGEEFAGQIADALAHQAAQLIPVFNDIARWTTHTARGQDGSGLVRGA